jgi:ABC-type transporter Mla subunit MlaD
MPKTKSAEPPSKPRAATRSASVAPKTRAKASPTRRKPASAPAQDAALGATVSELRELASQLTTSWSQLARVLEELPRTADLTPLADHLYEFARTTPALLESLRTLPALAVSVDSATHTLSEIAESLERAQLGLQNAVFHLPRPSEYEPLAEPLRDFARLSPALTGSLEAAPRLTSALEAVTQRMETAVERVETHVAQSAPPSTVSGTLAPGLLSVRLERIADAVAAAREAIRGALTSLPAAGDYAPVARQLKELASVSPSLMEWMREVPRLTTPLADAVDTLRAAADELDGAFVDVELTRRDLGSLDESN